MEKNIYLTDPEVKTFSKKINADIELINNEEKKSFLLYRDEPSTLTTQEKWGVFLLHTLYFLQGMPLGFFGLSVAILLTDAGADFSELGVLSFAFYPFCLKILAAPILDTYFFERFGKRKSYIVPCQYVLALLFFILSFYIEKMISEKKVGVLALIGFLMILTTAIQDIAVDGWNLTLLKNENLGWGAVAQGVGQSIGILFGGNILIQLSSTKFCNYYFYAVPRDDPLFNLNTFLLMFAIIILLINVWIHFFVKERNPKTMNEYPNIWALIKELKGFYNNKNLRHLVLFFITWSMGFYTTTTTSSYKLIHEGFPKETISTVLTCLIPFNFLISFLVGKYGRAGREMTHFLRYSLIIFLNNFFIYFLILSHGSISDGLFTFLFVISSLFGEGASTAIFINQGGFANRISDEDVGGTYLTFLNSVSNLGRFGTTSLVYFFVDIFNYNIVVFFGWIFSVIYFSLLYKVILEFEKTEKKEWKL